MPQALDPLQWRIDSMASLDASRVFAGAQNRGHGLWSMRLLLMVLAISVHGCQPAGQVDLPPSSPFPQPAVLSHGVAVGDVSAESAVVWLRTIGPAKARVQWAQDFEATTDPFAASSSLDVTTSEAQDFTASIRLHPLYPSVTYRYRIVAVDEDGTPASPHGPAVTDGRFRTAPASAQSAEVSILWTADLGGQQRCRHRESGYPILEAMANVPADFVTFLGDMIYADGPCPSPPNVPGSDFTAHTIDQYRAKHRYQRGDAGLQRLLSARPVYVTWDDHEVRNNFAGPHEPLMPIGRQAMLEYWPIQRFPDDPNRLYRSVRWGRTGELFLLDTRQYRDRNADLDGPGKTMLGGTQRQWLLEGLAKSEAVWKVIGSSVPLSIPKGGTLALPGNDSWARGADGTGFFTELSTIVQTLREKNIRNVIWLSADVHYVQLNRYDVDQDGQPDFYEFIAGPLSARFGLPIAPDPILHPTTFYMEAGFANFGRLSLRENAMTVEILDEAGRTRFAEKFEAR